MKTERETFDEELAALASRVGERNRRLFVVALKGRAAGLDGEELTRRIVEASGTPPLSAAEVRRAVDKVYKLPQTCRKQRESGGVAPRCDSRKRHGNPRLAGVLRGLSPQNTIEKRSSKGGRMGRSVCSRDDRTGWRRSKFERTPCAFSRSNQSECAYSGSPIRAGTRRERFRTLFCRQSASKENERQTF